MSLILELLDDPSNFCESGKTFTEKKNAENIKNAVCPFCNIPSDPDSNLDHVFPRGIFREDQSQGGFNIKVLHCGKCNNERSNKETMLTAMLAMPSLYDTDKNPLSETQKKHAFKGMRTLLKSGKKGTKIIPGPKSILSLSLSNKNISSFTINNLPVSDLYPLFRNHIQGLNVYLKEKQIQGFRYVTSEEIKIASWYSLPTLESEADTVYLFEKFGKADIGLSICKTGVIALGWLMFDTSQVWMLIYQKQFVLIGVVAPNNGLGVKDARFIRLNEFCSEKEYIISSLKQTKSTLENIWLTPTLLSSKTLII